MRPDDGPDDGPWTLPGVYLLADSGLADSGVAENGGAESGGGEVAVPGLTLTFLETGVVLMGADGETVWESRWSEVAEISPAGSSVLPDGGPALQLLAVERSGRRWCCLVVPTEDTEATAASVRQWARSHGLRSRSGPPAVRTSLTVAVAVLVVAVVTLLLLSAAHVLSF